jgi:hypothetical protein
LRQINPIHTLKFILILSFHQHLGLPIGIFLSDYPDQNTVPISISAGATCPVLVKKIVNTLFYLFQNSSRSPPFKFILEYLLGCVTYCLCLARMSDKTQPIYQYTPLSRSTTFDRLFLVFCFRFICMSFSSEFNSI